jgi:hypothetical protein
MSEEVCGFKSMRGRACSYSVFHVGNHSWQEITEPYESGADESESAGTPTEAGGEEA